MNKLSYIIPLHEINDEYKELLDRCIQSIRQVDNESTIIISTPKLLEIGIENNDNTLQLAKGENNDIQTLLENGIRHADTEYVSYIEFDDIVNKNYKRVFDKYSNMDFDMVMQLACKIDHKTQKVNGYLNQFYWSAMYSTNDSKLGNITLETLEKFKELPLLFIITLFSGSYIKKSVFDNVGYFKRNLPYNFFMEFIMRVAYKGYEIRITDEMTYVHTVDRPYSFDVLNRINTVDEKKIKSFIEALESEHRKLNK